jgi:ATP-dependent Lhr-like helicase
MTNLGTIPDSFRCEVYTRGDKSWVGSLDEEYLNTLEKGDVFALAGGKYEYRYRRGSKVYVDPTSARPTVPSWFSERLPLSYDLARRILDFQQTITSRMIMRGSDATLEWLLSEFHVDEHTANALLSIYEEQVLFTGFEGVATQANMPIEEYIDDEQERRYYFVHSLYGRTFNDGFSRLVGHRVAQEVNGNVGVAVSDHGFTLTLEMSRETDVARTIRSITPEEVEGHLRASLNKTDLLKRYFRINATRSLMILKNYKGREKSAAQQQVSSEMLLNFADELDEFAVMEETYREILEDKLSIDAIEDVLQSVAAGDIEVQQQSVSTPSPRAFGLATLAASDTVLADDQSQVLREFHERVQQALDRQ